MNLQEYLLVKLQEELMEVSMAVSKALTFGISDVNPHHNQTNATLMCREQLDVDVIVMLMRHFNITQMLSPLMISCPADNVYRNWKIGKVIYFAFQSADAGRLKFTTTERDELIQLSHRAEDAYERNPDPHLEFFHLPLNLEIVHS